MLKNSKIGYNCLFQIIIEYCKRLQNIWNTGPPPLGGLGGGAESHPTPPAEKKKFVVAMKSGIFR